MMTYSVENDCPSDWRMVAIVVTWFPNAASLHRLEAALVQKASQSK
ncbi:MAG: hypothetical protein Q7T85_12210 [Nitrosomonas sp.]|nr:hypothetical protein [Nitrosomonas sp.]